MEPAILSPRTGARRESADRAPRHNQSGARQPVSKNRQVAASSSDVRRQPSFGKAARFLEARTKWLPDGPDSLPLVLVERTLPPTAKVRREPQGSPGPPSGGRPAEPPRAAQRNRPPL